MSTAHGGGDVPVVHAEPAWHASRPEGQKLRRSVLVLSLGLLLAVIMHLVVTVPHDAWLLGAVTLTGPLLVGLFGAYALGSARRLSAQVVEDEPDGGPSMSAAEERRMRATRAVVLDGLIDQIPLGIACFDRTLRCVLVNEAMARLVELPVERRFGLQVRELFPGSLGDDVAEDMRYVIENGSPLTGLPVKIGSRARPNETRSCIVSYYVLRDASGGSEISGVGCTLEDVTHRVREEKEHRRLVTELRASLRARDDFLSIASHELRTPLSTLALGTSELMRAADSGTPPPPSQLRRQAERLRAQGQRLERLVATVLDVSRIVQGRVRLFPELLDVSKVVCEHAERLREEASRNGSALSLSCRDSIVGNFDRTRLEQIVDNLLSNAIKFGAGKPIHVAVEANLETVRLTVTDYGLGIPEEDRARIFERFERAVSPAHYGGLGLGLWVVRQIVESMGGTILVTSEVGEGSSFVVEWPRGLT